MKTLIQDWLRFLNLRRPVTTVQTYRAAMLAFTSSLPIELSIEDVKPSDIENFLQQLIQNRSTKTVNTYLAAVKSFYTWASNYHKIKNIARQITKLREPKQHIRILSDDDYRTILHTTKGSVVHHSIQFLANTGLRHAEFRQLTWDDFNGDFVHVTGKGSRERLVPLNTVCRGIINQHQICGGYPYFVEPFKKQAEIYTVCRKISHKAKIPYFTPHAFRHYFATRLIRAGIPLIVVSKILGHSSTTITEKIYVHLTADDLRVTNIINF